MWKSNCVVAVGWVHFVRDIKLAGCVVGNVAGQVTSTNIMLVRLCNSLRLGLILLSQAARESEKKWKTCPDIISRPSAMHVPVGLRKSSQLGFRFLSLAVGQIV